MLTPAMRRMLVIVAAIVVAVAVCLLLEPYSRASAERQSNVDDGGKHG